MSGATLEHVNITVSDPHKTADMICKLFDWRIRWEGPSAVGGYTIHVGNDDVYVALYSEGKTQKSELSNYRQQGGLNHIGIVVDDLDGTEQRILDAGYKTQSHGDYEPGRRFYFLDRDGVEFEVISYK